eukprot:s1383_g7.t2
MFLAALRRAHDHFPKEMMDRERGNLTKSFQLAAQMAAATAPQAEAKVDDDLAKLNAYFEEKQVLANRQAGRILSVSSIHRTFAFQKCKGMLGSVGPVSRARVCDLWGDEDNKTTPLQRVQQRGVRGTQEILKSLMDGMATPAGKPIIVADLVARNGEISAGQHQVRVFAEESECLEFEIHFLGFKQCSSLGVARNSKDKHLPWMLENDQSLVVFLDPARGKDDGVSVKMFRYRVKPNAKLNCFEPKALDTEGADASVRSSQLGAAMLGRFTKYPFNGPNCALLWEAR